MRKGVLKRPIHHEVGIAKNLRQMDKESLLIIKSGSEMLRARDALESKRDKTDRPELAAV